MDIRKMQKLQDLGWDEEWLLNVKSNFHPKKRGKYQIKIYTIDDLNDRPEDGIWIDTTCFSDDVGLSIVHYFFEGQAYVLTLTETGEEIGRGIIDGAPFDEVELYETEHWTWLQPEQLSEEFARQRAEESRRLAEGHARVRKRKIYIVTTQSKDDYTFSVTTKKHGAYNSFENAVARVKQEVKEFKKNYKSERKEYSDREYYEDESDGLWTEYEDYDTGYWAVSFGFEERHEYHCISVDEFKIED